VKTELTKRVIASCSWRLRRLRFAATHEWLRSPPYVLRHAGFDLLYSPGNALALRFCLTGRYEPEVEAFLESALQPGAVVVDVGANIGFFTLAVLAKSEGLSCMDLNRHQVRSRRSRLASRATTWGVG
jgi:hypothetical protein